MALTADFEKGTNGATILAADPGSLSAWDSVGGSPTYTGTHIAHGSLGAAFVSNAQNYLRWGTSWPGPSDFYGRFYLYYGSVPASQQNICQIHTGSDSIQIRANTAGTLAVYVSGVNANSATVLTPGSEYRIEFHFVASPTAASGEVKIFAGDSATPLETFNKVATTNSATTTNHDFGFITSFVVWTGVVFDQIVSACTSYPGPYPVNSVAPTVSGSAAQGSTLTAAAGTYNGTFTKTYQWQRAGVDITGATASTYVTQAADVGHAVGVREIATGQQATNESISTASSNTVTVTGGSGGGGTWNNGFLRSSSGALVRGSGSGTLQNGFMRDSSGAVLFGSATPTKLGNGFIRDANGAIVEDAGGSGTWDTGFVRGTGWSMVTVTEANAVQPVTWQNGFLRDATGAIVTDT